MNQFKRAQVIILSTENKQSGKVLWIDSLFSKLEFNYCNYWNNIYHKRVKLYHLYIVSDDEIKIKDKVIEQLTDGSFSIFNIDTFNDIHNNGTQRKIIATTDTSLNISEYAPQLWKYLPQPSQQFIEKFVKCYNKGKIITDVLVEYEEIVYDTVPYSMKKKLKINPKDNTITIKKLKDSRNREEIIELFKKHNLDLNKNHNLSFIQDFTDKWIKENL